MSVGVVDVLAVGAGLLSSAATLYSIKRLWKTERASRALSQRMHASHRRDKLLRLLTEITAAHRHGLIDPADSREAISEVLKQIQELDPGQQDILIEALEQNTDARRAFVSKVLRESVELKTASVR